MEKGKYGIRLSFYAVLAFVFALLGYTTPLFLLAGVVIIAEKNEWASRQVIQAICLALFDRLADSVIDLLFDMFHFVHMIPFIGTFWGTFSSLAENIISLAILIFGIIGLIRVSKGNEAKIPLADKFANWAYSIAATQ